uniref:GDP-fucose protein O-fucosyltransferase 1 n=1 Tax=Plectus sambesii TaxID=2011161 RepID=A0A914V590_9BILA
MGRFGNQAEHFLGGLAFAKQLNRTLILPPWRTYKNVEFDEWFIPSAMEKYHRVILAKDFMAHLAETVWPQEKRFGFCYQMYNQPIACEVKDGNPFKNFWDELNVDFSKIVGHSLNYQEPQTWIDTYDPENYPVIALKGAPASFPMRSEHIPLQQFLHFSEGIQEEATDILMRHFGSTETDYVAVHLRNGIDWQRACEHVSESGPAQPFMASYQCLPSPLKRSMCLPSMEQVLELTKTIMRQENAHKLLIATDQYSYVDHFKEILGKDVQVVHPDPWLPVVDQYLLAHSRHFIGNCVSSFSSFVWRHRKSHNLGLSSHFGI